MKLTEAIRKNNHLKDGIRGKYCGEHPLTQREVLDNDMEGMTISGVECPYRQLTPFGWQSFCRQWNRTEMGCEKE